MLNEKAITAVSGRKIKIEVDSICVHGDNPAAVIMAKRIRESIINNGFKLCSFNEFVD
jgi:UPF0271 protein